MVDDILTVTDVEKSKEVNNLINTFIEHKKLRLSHSKCVRIHIGSGHKNGPTFKVHEKTIRDEEEEKCLGDIDDKSGNITKTIEFRNQQYIITTMISDVTHFTLN